MGIMAYRRELTLGKNEVQLRGLIGRASSLKLVAELRQGHPLHWLVHDTSF